METPLHQETATADLISDIVAFDRPQNIPDLAHELAAGSGSWRNAWAVGSVGVDSPVDHALTSVPLKYDEDEELRGLNYLAEVGSLTGAKAERLIELRLRDRRSEVRPPRGFVMEEDLRPRRKWYQLRWRQT